MTKIKPCKNWTSEIFFPWKIPNLQYFWVDYNSFALSPPGRHCSLLHALIWGDQLASGTPEATQTDQHLWVWPRHPSHLLLLVLRRLLQGLDLFGDPAVTFFLGGELLHTSLLGKQLWPPLLRCLQPEEKEVHFKVVLPWLLYHLPTKLPPDEQQTFLLPN